MSCNSAARLADVDSREAAVWRTARLTRHRASIPRFADRVRELARLEADEVAVASGAAGLIPLDDDRTSCGVDRNLEFQVAWGSEAIDERLAHLTGAGGADG